MIRQLLLRNVGGKPTDVYLVPVIVKVLKGGHGVGRQPRGCLGEYYSLLMCDKQFRQVFIGLTSSWDGRALACRRSRDRPDEPRLVEGHILQLPDWRDHARAISTKHLARCHHNVSLNREFYLFLTLLYRAHRECA